MAVSGEESPLHDRPPASDGSTTPEGPNTPERPNASDGPIGSDVPSASDVPSGGWPDPQAIYIHVPFCRHRCGYCNFSVVADRDDLIDRFLIAIDRELQSLERPAVKTVFVGGGTPTHLDHTQLSQLLSTINDRIQMDSNVEWSIEANPEDITTEKLALIKQHGVNRISLGVQSFDDQKLVSLDRSHSGALARRAIDAALELFENVSIDLIFAAPGETLDVWRRDLEAATQFPLAHLSTYALTFEKGTRFWNQLARGQLQSLGESIEVDMYQMARRVIATAGLLQYEISNFARSGFQCRHNLAYWDGQGWYAAGPGAARFVSGHREVNHRSTTTYLRRSVEGRDLVAESDTISCQQYARERAAFGIRLIHGIDLDAISQSTGIDVHQLCRQEIERCICEGLVEQNEGRLRLTEQGILFADTVASRLLG